MKALFTPFSKTSTAGRHARVRAVIRACVVSGCAATILLGAVAHGQAPARGAAPAPARGAAAAPAAKVYANLNQLMRGVVYPAANVAFAGQNDPTKFKQDADAATSPNPLTSTYGGWEAVANAGLTIAESANLMMVSGRACSNGKPAPVRRADWIKFTQTMRDAGLETYKAAQAKNLDGMVDATGNLSDSCTACHEVYRDKPAGRCM
jgi:hypothetical protein